jgi:hypothetical protein
MKTFKTFIEQAKWRKNPAAYKTPDGSVGPKYDDDYHKWVPSKHDGGKPKQSLGDTPTKPGSLQKRTPVDHDLGFDVTKKGKLTKRATKSLKDKIKARND